MFKVGQNIGTFDRVIRLIIGLSFIYIGFTLLIGLIQFVFIVLGLALLLNTITGFCGVYYLLGISTCKIVKKTKN